MSYLGESDDVQTDAHKHAHTHTHTHVPTYARTHAYLLPIIAGFSNVATRVVPAATSWPTVVVVRSTVEGTKCGPQSVSKASSRAAWVALSDPYKCDTETINICT